MHFERRPFSYPVLVFLMLGYSLLATQTTWAQRGMQKQAQVPITPEMLDDARLNDVYFLNPDLGWAVGDRGVILHTEDGGRHWHVQQVPTTCRLESVHFIDSQHGWVAGGQVHPYNRRTSCLVARTTDGGQTWSVIPDLTLPLLKHVHFHDARQGWAVGEDSTLYPAGVFRTSDGGRSWTTLPADRLGAWTTGDFRDPKHGVVAGYDGKLGLVAGPRISSSRTPDLGNRPLRALQMRDRGRGWLVGDGGLVMQTTDGGNSWQHPSGELPPGITAQCDFRALSVLEDHIWIAGSPGTVILRSPDSGNSWEVFTTDQQVPLRSMVFVDPDRGWAVGELGTILATRDGGRTWRRQRTGGTRLALLGIFSEANRVPLELFALQSGDEGYLGFAEILTRRDIELPSQDRASLEDQAHAALSTVGACGAEQTWRFPLRQAGLMLGSKKLMDAWDRANDGRGVAVMEELLVRGIRQWRPEVVITEAPSPHGDHPLSHLVNQIVLSAVNNAADPTAFPDHATVVDLEPWTVKKVFCVSDDPGQATVRLSTAQLATRLGRSVAEHATDGYAMVRSAYEPSPVTMGFQLLQNRLPQSAGRTNVFSGIHLQPGGDARRRTSRPPTRDLESLTRAAQKRRNIERVFQMTSGASSGAAAWLGQVEDLTRTLTPSSAGHVLFQLGQRYREGGRLELAAQTLGQLVQRYPHHPLNEHALVWLVQYYSSSEIAWQLQRGTRFDAHAGEASVTKARMTQSAKQPGELHEPTPRASANRPAHVAVPARARTPAALKKSPPSMGVVQAGLETRGHTTTAGPQFEIGQRAASALDYAKMVQRGRPALFAEPELQFPMAVAYRATGLSGDAERFYHRLGASPVPSDWGRCAQAELWLSHGRGKPPKKMYRCRKVTSRPHLDGKLDDHAWQQAEKLELTSAQHDDGQWPAAAMLACDNQFLFLAASCRKSAERDYPNTPGPRPRDPNLQDYDRVELFIDLDRDYVSFYRLTVDHRGWTGESCLGNDHWNPTWYVASAATENEWTIEAAIPLKELTSTPPGKDDVWAVGMHRIVPGVGIQSFTKPATVVPRGEGFALMMFQ